MTAEPVTPPDGPPEQGRLGGLKARFGGVAGDATWGLVSEVAALVTSLGVFYIVTTQLGPEGYGLYAGVQALAVTLAILGGSWMALVLIQEVVREGRSVADVMPIALGPTVVAGSVVTVGAALLGPSLLPGLSWELIGAFTGAEVLGQGITVVGVGAIQAALGYGAATRFRVILNVWRVTAVVLLLVVGDVSLPSLAATLVLVNVVAAVGMLSTVRRVLDVPIRLALPRWPDLRSGLSYAGISAAFAVQEDSDKVLMVRFASAFDAGVYAAGYRATQMALLPIRALLSSSHNRFLAHESDVAGLHLRRSLRFSAVAGSYGIAASIALVAAAPLVNVVLGGEYEEATSVVRWVAVLVALRSLSLLPSNGLMGLRRNGPRLVILVVCAATNVVGTALLIRTYSWRGAAMATIGSEVLFLVATWVALVHYQRVDDRRAASRSALPAPVHQAP